MNALKRKLKRTMLPDLTGFGEAMGAGVESQLLLSSVNQWAGLDGPARRCCEDRVDCTGRDGCARSAEQICREGERTSGSGAEAEGHCGHTANKRKRQRDKVSVGLG